MRPRRLSGASVRPLNFTVRGQLGDAFVSTPSAAPQSTFVTVLAWLTIVDSGFVTVVSLEQNVAIPFLMPATITNSPYRGAFLAAQAFFFGFFCFVAFMTYAGYALLKRRNWARRLFIGVCGLGIAWGILCIVMFAFGFGVGRFPTPGALGAPRGMDSGFKAMEVMTSILCLGLCVLFGWVIRRLQSPSVRAEFGQADVVP